MTRVKFHPAPFLALSLVFVLPQKAAPFASLVGGGGPPVPSEVVVKFHDEDQVLLAVSNTGQIGIDLFSLSGAGFWPGNTPNRYVFGTGMMLAGIADIDGDGEADTLFVMGYDGNSGGSDFAEGSHRQSPGDPLASVFRSTDSQDLSNWPQEFRIQDTNPESGTYGEMVPLVISDQDLVTIYNSVEAIPLFSEPNPPLEVRQRSLAFRSGRIAQVIIFIFDIENLSQLSQAGPFSLEEAWLGFFADMDIGTEFTDDRTSFFTEQITPEGNTIPINMGFAWDENFHESNFVGAPGFVGVAYLQSPGNDYDGIDNDGDGMVDESPFDDADDDGDGVVNDIPDEVDQMGLVNYSNFWWWEDAPRSDHEGYRFMSCTPSYQCHESTEDQDVKYMISSGPFRIRPGETHRLVLAFVFADAVGDPSSIPVYGDPPRPDPNDIYFEEFLAAKQTAQAIYDLGFVRATPPPRPWLKLVPGDRQVTVLWDESPVYAADDLYDDFAALDPDYRQYDFEGYRLWRSVTGKFSKDGDPDDPLNPVARARNEENPELDLALLGQWDLANGITTIPDGIVVTDSVIDQAGSLIVLSADTFDLGEDTGLRFSFVDRGEPASLLVNGLRYYYCVESYDYNSPSLPLSRLSLGNGVVFSRENSASPRSNASSYLPAQGTVAHVDTLGNILPDRTPEEFIYLEPPQASDALRSARIAAPEDGKIEDTWHELVVDAVMPNWDGATSEVRYHMEDASGRRLHTRGEAQSLFTMKYDSTLTPVLVTVFDPADSTVPLYELSLELFAHSGAYQVPPVSALGAVDSKGTDITETLGSVLIPPVQFMSLGFRGTDIVMAWHELGPDTLTMSVYDMGNRVTVPSAIAAGDSMKAQNWFFDRFGGQPGGMFLIGSPTVFKVYVCGTVIAPIEVTRRPQAGDMWTLRQRSYYVSAEGDTVPGSRPLVPWARYRVSLTGGGQDRGELDMKAIRVVPNPYTGYSEFETGGGARKIQFINLPAECTIRIYTIAGVLVRVLEHTMGEAGTEDYDLKTREGLPLASGNYYYHVTVPDGRTHLGRFAVIQ